jgi:uncharacterized protein (DUF1015 family)
LAETSPFQGIRYNQEIIKDMSAVICPPYDIISPDEQKYYYNLSDYNVIRLEHGMDQPDDSEINNKHSRSSDTFGQWLKDGILKVDTAPTFYIYEQGFEYEGTIKKRLGLIACVKLEPWENRVILPHEHTTRRDRSDRLDLLRACNANISPVMGLYDDPGQKITKLMIDKMRPSKLLIDINNNDKTHKIWKANEPEFVQRVSHFLTPKSIILADGHHRYETALTYMEERRQNAPGSSGYEGFNFIMMTLVSFSDPGIIMLPVHRLLKKLEPQVITELSRRLGDFFEIKSFPLTGRTLYEGRENDIRVLGLEPGCVTDLKLRSDISLDEFMPEGRSSVYLNLNVSIVEHIIIERLLGNQVDKDDIKYTPDIGMAKKVVENGQCQLAILLGHIPISTIKSIADAKDRMPRKSTFFHPKLPTGLVINRLDGKL